MGLSKSSVLAAALLGSALLGGTHPAVRRQRGRSGPRGALEAVAGINIPSPGGAGLRGHHHRGCATASVGCSSRAG